MVKNPARVEGSICNANLVRETTLFCSYYFEPHVKTKKRVVPRNDDGGASIMDNSLIDVFKHPGRGQGRVRTRTMSTEERDSIHSYVMLNSADMEVYITLVSSIAT